MHNDKDVAATFLLFITSKMSLQMCCSLAVTVSLSYTYSTVPPLLFIPCPQLPHHIPVNELILKQKQRSEEKRLKLDHPVSTACSQTDLIFFSSCEDVKLFKNMFCYL